MLELIRNLAKARRDERGASAVEYGLLVAAIAAVVVGVVFALGSIVDTSFSGTCSDIATESGDAVPADCGGAVAP